MRLIVVICFSCAVCFGNVCAVSAQSTSERPTVLQLNNGATWEADEHTIASVRRMQDLLLHHPSWTVEDALLLANGLRSEIGTLIKGCTMTGRAHDQLHLYLKKLTQSVNALSEATTPADARREYGAVSKVVNNFDRYFGPAPVQTEEAASPADEGAPHDAHEPHPHEGEGQGESGAAQAP